jgi:hypothetical protein
LTDPTGEASVEVEGTIADPGASRGEFTFTDSDAVLQGALEGKTFRLSIDDGTQLDVRLESVSAGDTPGTSHAEFSKV